MTAVKNTKQKKDDNIKASQIKKDLKKLVLYSEIMKPKYKEGIE